MWRCVLTVALAAAGCGISPDLYNQKVTELLRAEQELSAMRSELGAERRELSDLRRDTDRLQHERAQLEEARQKLAADLNTTSHQLDELSQAQKQAKSRERAYQGLHQQLRAMISGGKLQVEVRKGRMIVVLPETQLFDPVRGELSAEGQDTLRQVAASLRAIPDRDFLVTGHTDNGSPSRRGKFASNWELSAAHAVEVSKFLQQNGVDPRHLGAAGYSEFDPVADNGTDEGRALNRRIEIVVMPNAQELPQLDEAHPEAVARPGPAPSRPPPGPAPRALGPSGPGGSPLPRALGPAPPPQQPPSLPRALGPSPPPLQQPH